MLVYPKKGIMDFPMFQELNWNVMNSLSMSWGYCQEITGFDSVPLYFWCNAPGSSISPAKNDFCVLPLRKNFIFTTSYSGVNETFIK
jgi:hypothetical protein